MALVDLQSDLSKFRSTVKTSSEIKPENSVAKSSKAFGAFQPITDKLSSFSVNINRIKTTQIESKLDSTRLDDVIKEMKNDLIVNSVSIYSPLNATKDSPTIGRISVQDITSRFGEIKREEFSTRLNKSDILILRSESGINNQSSPIDVNTLIAKTLDRKSSSPNVYRVRQTDEKSNSSPSINTKSNESINNITNPDIAIDKTVLSTDRSNESPDVLIHRQTDNKEIGSPNLIIMENTDDKTSSSPNVINITQTIDRTNQSPIVNDIPQTPDKSALSPNVFGIRQSDNKEQLSPEIQTGTREYENNVTNPDTEVFGKPLSFDRQGQSVLINKDLVSPINNIINPNIALDENVLTFDRTKQSPEIFAETIKSGLVVNPNTPVVRIEQGTYHLIDESRLNLDGIPIRFERTTRIADKDPLQMADTNRRYNGESVQTTDTSQYNINGIPQKTNPSGRNDSSDRSILSTKGTQEVNFFGDLNASGFNSFASIGATKYNVDSSKYTTTSNTSVNFFDVSRQYTSAGFTNRISSLSTEYKNGASNRDWDGNAQSAPSVNGFKTFVEYGQTQFAKDSSKFGWSGANSSAPSVDYLDVGKKNSKSGFHTFAAKLDSKLNTESSEFGWKGNSRTAPETNFFDIPSKFTESGFSRLMGIFESKFKKDSSVYGWNGTSQNAPSINAFVDLNSEGFNTFTQQFQTNFNSESSKFGFKGTLPNPVNFFTDTNATGFQIKPVSGETSFVKDSSIFSFKGTSRQSPSVNFIQDTFNTGFTNFASSLTSEFKPDSSRFTFKGTGRTAPESNFFFDTSNEGFKRWTDSLQSTYKPTTSKYTWNGNRQNAPEVNFFYIAGENPNAIAGFTKFFNDKSEPKLSDEYSRLSFSGTTIRSSIRPVPYTSYFGYTPYERSGFMINMSTFDGTLYPNINPTLKYNDDAATRYGIEQIRSLRGGLKTDNNEKYAPKSLGPRPWIDGTLSSTLDSQIPDGGIKTGAKAGSYLNKYEKSLKEGTSNLGFLTKWATTRRSPSPLDEQYLKYKLQNESVNREISAFNQPFIVRGIQRDGAVENQRWGFGVTFDDGIIRGGAITQAERIAADVIRIGKWSVSMKGLLWNIKQLGLQAMNPAVDVNPSKPESGIFGVSSTLVYNPLSLIGNVAGASLGIRLPRHGILPFSISYLNRYEDATVARELKHQFTSPDYTAFDGLTPPTIVNRQTSYNRLIGLMKELLPNSFKPVVARTDGFDATISQLTRKGIELVKELSGQTGITRISSNFGGPQSFLGIGGTQIDRARHPYLTHYTTTPLLMLTGEQKEPQFPVTAKRDTYYAATSMYKDTFNDALRTIAYNLPNGPYERNDENLPRDKSNIKQVQPSIVDRIIKQNPFDTKYDLFKNRLRAVSSTDVYKNGQISDALNPENIDGLNPIKLYRSLTYDKLGVSRDRRRSKNGSTGMGDLNDFRSDLNDELGNLKFFSTDPSISDYATNNLEDRYGFGKHGKVGIDRSKPFKSMVSYVEKNGVSVPQLKDKTSEFRGDRINIIDFKRGQFEISKDFVYEVGSYKNESVPGAEDLVEFYFTGVMLKGTESRPAEAIAFRATFDSISDNHNSEWKSIEYLGRADPLYVYQGYDRDISFSFTVHLTSRDEMKATWRKLNHLSSWTAPEYTKGGFMRAPIIRLNIGNLYRKLPGFLANVRYTFDNTETTWETAKLKDDQLVNGANGADVSPGVLQLPKMIRVECAFTPIGMYRPEYNGIMYSLYDDTNAGGLETGLVPQDDVRVNYFKTYDVNTAGSPQTSDLKQNKDYYRIKPGEESVIPEIIESSRENLASTETSTNRTGTDITGNS
jgi:hypothetical protein